MQYVYLNKHVRVSVAAKGAIEKPPRVDGQGSESQGGPGVLTRRGHMAGHECPPSPRPLGVERVPDPAAVECSSVLAGRILPRRR